MKTETTVAMEPEDLAIERVALILAAEGYTVPELRAVAGDCDLKLRIADAVEALAAP
jgi:hypothetical protein